MSEYEALNLMYLGFTFNAIYTLGFILFTWLGFRRPEVFMKTQLQQCLARYSQQYSVYLSHSFTFNQI